MIQYRLILLIVVSFASCEFLEEQIDFQGLKKCLNQFPIEMRLTKELLPQLTKKNIQKQPY